MRSQRRRLCEQLFAPPAAFDFVARLRWPSMLPSYVDLRPWPPGVRSCCSLAATTVTASAARYRLFTEVASCEFQHNVAPTCQGLPSKSTRVARPRLSLDRLAGAASAHSRLGHSLL